MVQSTLHKNSIVHSSPLFSAFLFSALCRRKLIAVSDNSTSRLAVDSHSEPGVGLGSFYSSMPLLAWTNKLIRAITKTLQQTTQLLV